MRHRRTCLLTIFALALLVAPTAAARPCCGAPSPSSPAQGQTPATPPYGAKLGRWIGTIGGKDATAAVVRGTMSKRFGTKGHRTRRSVRVTQLAKLHFEYGDCGTIDFTKPVEVRPDGTIFVGLEGAKGSFLIRGRFSGDRFTGSFVTTLGNCGAGVKPMTLHFEPLAPAADITPGAWSATSNGPPGPGTGPTALSWRVPTDRRTLVDARGDINTFHADGSICARVHRPLSFFDPIALAPDGTFAVDDDGLHVTGRFTDAGNASGRLELTDGDCSSGDIAWTASPAGS